jgi:hypothetical protein
VNHRNSDRWLVSARFATGRNALINVALVPKEPFELIGGDHAD